MDAGSTHGSVPPRWDSIQGGDGVTWHVWARRTHVELWQGLALNVGLDPDSIDQDPEQAVLTMDLTLRSTLEEPSQSAGPFGRYLLICLFAIGEIAQGKLKVHASAREPLRSVVRLDLLNEWARWVGIRTIEGWPEPDSWLEVCARRDKPDERSKQADLLRMVDRARVLWAAALADNAYPTAPEIEAKLLAEFPHANGNARKRAVITTRPPKLPKGRPPGRKAK